jgi:beta-galactosidase
MNLLVFLAGAGRGRSLLVGSLVLACAATAAAARAGESIDFRGDWKFLKGDNDGAAAVEFDDAAWAPVRLPHDWAIAGPFNESERSGFAAKLPWRGVGWYRKHFRLDQADGDRVYLDFDGVMAFPQVFVNGKLAGDWDYGYTSFRVDATPFVNLKGDNVVAVRVDTTNHGTRWYPGAGIYRKVTMAIERPVHIAHWGVYVTTPEVSDAEATVAVDAAIENHREADAKAQVEFAVLDPAGKEQAKRTFELDLPPGEKHIGHSFAVPNPVKWDIGAGNLYTLRTIVKVDGQAVDQSDEPFGIRSFELTADDGFHLNGRRVQLYGVCLHHDQGPLGGAFYKRAMERQLQIMRDMGVNAIRTSHNAPAPELLELCDRMGLFVWDECFDKWNETADRPRRNPPTHQQHAERHLRSLVMRDRNHPSVFVWSIGNEIPADREGSTPERMKMMRDVVLKYDATRPVGIACHIPEQVRQNMFDALDFTGWNYSRRYAMARERYPNKPIIYSESASALSTRGFYKLPLPTTKTDYATEAHQVDSYDFNAAPWSDIADREFKLMHDDPFVAGEFVWTGFDYLGEPTPFDREAKNSYFGIVDLCGMPKDRFYLYRSHWRPDETTIHILPHWNWPDRVGQNVPVMVYTNGDSAELFLNGKSLGRRTKGQSPPAPTNFAKGRPATASSTEAGNEAASAADDNLESRWCASSGEPEQWFQVDLGEVRPLKYLMLEFEREAKNYGYEVKVSSDQKSWQTVVTQPTSREPMWGGPRAALFDLDALGRYVRVEFKNLVGDSWASIREFGVYDQRAESQYYAPTYDYRLRWNDVVYEPGELKVVAYKDGRPIGEATMRTAGEPAALRLRPDRRALEATGDDLCYVQVEALDGDGNPCPLADNLVTFTIDGPAEIAGVGNGNPISYEPFQADHRQLFYGKAMLILRTKPGAAGEIHITAKSDGLESGAATCTATAK